MRWPRGDLLCRFDDESARLSLQNAQAAVNSAQESYNSAVANYGGADLPLLQEQLRLAQDNYEDTQALMEIGAASQAEVDQAHQTFLSAQAGLEAAQASLSSAQAGIQSAQVGVESAQYQLSLYNLTAPIAGVVEAVNVTENNFAASGTAAFVISNGSNKTVTFYVTDSVRQTLTPGEDAVAVSLVFDLSFTNCHGFVCLPANYFLATARHFVRSYQSQIASSVSRRRLPFSIYSSSPSAIS